ncbi:MAG: hypothetical protein OEM43_07285 [Gammaproteobacteria bacterium]|nr:hypothetical protein [Gammaproteobacteria bacterium]
MRVKSKWNLKDKQRSLSETGGAMAFILWRIAQQGVLNLENEGFQTDTNAQRLDIIAEFLAFLVHLVDRMTSDDLGQNERVEFITALARHLADNIQQNRTDAEGKGEYRQALVDLLNQRAADYAEFSFTDNEPGFAFRRYFGENVRAVMGAKDNKWITDQVMDIEAPEALIPLRKALRDLFA